MANATLVDIIVEAMPFSNELRAWINTHSDFLESLKFSNTDRFLPLGMVVTSYTKNAPNDEIIGFYSYDYQSGKFKQDFIVNLGSNNKEFVLYTSLPTQNRNLYGQYVKHIKEFFGTYGKNGEYANTHYPTMNDIRSMGNIELTARAERAAQNGANLKANGMHTIPQHKLNEVMRQIKEIKSGGLH